MKCNQNDKLNLWNKIGKVPCWIIWDSKMHRAHQCTQKNYSASPFAAENNSQTDDENSEEVKIVFKRKDVDKLNNR